MENGSSLVEIDKLISEFMSKGMSEEEAKRKAMLAIKRLAVINAQPRELIFLSAGRWIENPKGDIQPLRFLDVETKTIKTAWNRSGSATISSLEPLDRISILVRGTNSFTIDDVSSSSLKKLGKAEPEVLRNCAQYRKLKDLISNPVDGVIVTEGDVLFNPKEVSNGNLLLKLTDIYDDPGEVPAVFIDPNHLIDEVTSDDRVIVVGVIRVNEGQLIGGYTINADLVARVKPPE